MAVRGQARRTNQRRDPGRSRALERRDIYVEGSTARELLALPEELIGQSNRKLSHTARKNRERAAHMNPGYVIFLCVAMLITGYVCIQYLKLQADITSHIHNIASMESELNEKKTENDEEYSRIMSSVDLEEVKRIAMDELGMTYARDGQVVTFESEESDYVRQYQDISK